jgi:hypothetical protein
MVYMQRLYSTPHVPTLYDRIKDVAYNTNENVDSFFAFSARVETRAYKGEALHG